jgi:tRNA(Ile)-lysidine synthase
MSVDVATFGSAHLAVRTRALRQAAAAAGARAGDLKESQIQALERLVSDWRGQGAVALPGRIAVRRKCGKLEFRALPDSDQALKEA